jgi:hypothetical protein
MTATVADAALNIATFFFAIVVWNQLFVVRWKLPYHLSGQLGAAFCCILFYLEAKYAHISLTVPPFNVPWVRNSYWLFASIVLIGIAAFNFLFWGIKRLTKRS